jgi:anti-anti-sigma factor
LNNRVEPFTIELLADAATPRMARHEVAERLGDLPGVEELLLCVSEVVTNAVIHAGTPRHLSVRQEGNRLVIEVADGDPRPPVRRNPDPTSPTGRGLRLLDDLATAWDWRPTDDGKVVWFEFPGPEPSEPSDRGPSVPGSATTDGARAGATVVAEREIDLLSASVLRDRLEQAIEAGARHLTIDFSGCEFLDSTGLSVVATTALRLRRVGGHLEEVGAHGAVENVLRLSGVGELLRGDPP